MNNSPKVTVLMAVHNGAQTLRRAIDSTLTQTFQDFEFLIIDDCSTDNTVELIKSYQDKRIRLHCNDTNMGQTKSLNKGLELSRGEYIARMDADDYSMPMRLERQYQFMIQNPQYAVVGTDCLVIDESNNKKKISKGCVQQGDIILKMLYASPINHVSALMSLKCLRDVEGYSSRFIIAADFDLWSKLVRKGYQLTTIPETLAAYTFSGGSYSHRNALIKYEEVTDIVYDNVCIFSDCKVCKDDIRVMLQMFLGDIIHMSQDSISKSQHVFRNIAEQIRLEFCQKIEPKKINQILSQSHYLAAYRFILEGKTLEARKMLRNFVSHNGVSLQAFVMFFLSYTGPKLVKQANYYKSKYF